MAGWCRAQHPRRAVAGPSVSAQRLQPEAGQMRLPIRIDKNFSRLNVAMQNAALVSEMDGARQFDDQLNGAADWQGLLPNDLIKLPAIDTLHAEVA